MKTKKQFTNRILSLVLALVMVVGLLPQKAAAAGTLIGFDTYGITFREISLSDSNTGSSWKVYNKEDDNKWRAEASLTMTTGALSNGNVTVQYTFSYKDKVDTKTGTFNLDCSCDKTYEYADTISIDFGGGYSLRIHISKENKAHNTIWSQAGNNTHTGTCSVCNKETGSGNCSGSSTANCTVKGTCTACRGQYNDPSVHVWKYTAAGNVVTASCDCGNATSQTATLDYKTGNETYTYTGLAIEPLTVKYSNGWKGTKVDESAISYENNLNIGTANASVTVEGKTITTTFQITEADISGATVAFDPESGTYTGTAYNPAVTVTWNGKTLKADTDYTLNLDKNGYTDAGTYTVLVVGVGNFNGSVKKSFTIYDATLTGIEVKQDGTLTYDGTAQTPQVTKTAVAVNNQSVTFKYSMVQDGTYGDMPTFTDAGTFTVWYKVSAPNHKTSDPQSFTVSIGQATNEWTTEPSIDDWTYGETASTPNKGEAKFGTASVTYSGTAYDGTTTYTNSETAPTEAGEYTATFTVEGNDNYTGLEENVTFTIEKKTVDLSGVQWNYNGAFKYDGISHGVAIEETTLPEGASVSNYTGHTSAETGKFKAAAAIEYDDNHQGEGTLFLDWEIENNWTPAVDTEYTVSIPNEAGWVKEDFVVTAKDGYELSLQNTAEDENWSETLTCEKEADEGSITFYVRNKDDGTISLGATETYKLDKTAPTGTVSIDDNEWNELLNYLTFGLFFNKTKTVEVEPEDALSDLANSGIAKVEYYDSDVLLYADEVKAITDWTDMGEDFAQDVTAEDAKTFIYYIRITDIAGNVTYISTADATYDLTAPAISGITNGNTYYTTQKVKVTDINLETVTLNEEDVTDEADEITLEGNVEKTYTIVATDKAGNITTVTVKMAEIADITDKMEDKTKGNVTSDDKANLQAIADTAAELLKDEDITAEEKAELEKAKADAQALIAVINAAQDATDTENIGKVEDITAENVKPENKDALEKAKADLEKALADNSGNYTEKEKKTIEGEIDRIDKALKIVENVEAAEKIVGDLPKTVEPDDNDTVAAIEKAKKAYSELSDYEKTLVDKDTKEKLDNLTAAIIAYDIVKGDGSKWTKGSSDGLSFTANGAYSKFIGIKVDGKDVDKANYEAKSGSTIITLKNSYLETLSAGKHTITVLYTDGETDGTFTIGAKAASPATGDDFNVMLWTAMFFGSILAMAALVIYRKRLAHKGKYVNK